MEESNCSPNVAPPQRSSSIRLRKRRDDMKQQFVKNRRSGEFGYKLISDAVDNTGNTEDVLTNSKVDTFDPLSGAGGVQHSLRPLLRDKYIQCPLSDTEECWDSDKLGKGRGTRMREDGVKIKHFGMIDQTSQVESTGYLSEKYFNSLSLPDTEEEISSSSLNCFGVPSVSTVLERGDCGPFSLPLSNPSVSLLSNSDSPTVRGVMWVQREKIFSRWKERFFILTTDYLQCFKRGTTQGTEMGHFLFQVRLSGIQSMSLVDRRGYLTVVVGLEKEDNLMVRRPENVREWYNTLQKTVKESKTRVMESTEQLCAKKTVMDPEKMEEWLVARARIGALYQYTADREERPGSAASIDRKMIKHRKRAQSEYTSRLPDEISQTSAPVSIINMRSVSADRKRHCRGGRDNNEKVNVSRATQISNVRSVVLSEDSGNSSLTTSTADSRKSAKSIQNVNKSSEDTVWLTNRDNRGRYSVEGCKQ